MRRSGVSRSVTAVAAVALLAAACGKSGNGPGSGGSSNAKGPIAIGVVSGLTGDSAILGVPFVKGAEMARDEINKAGGIGGRQVKLFVEDNQTDPNAGTQAAEKLIDVNKANILVCGCFSTVFFPIDALAAQKHMVVVDGDGASSPLVRKQPPSFVTLLELDDSGGKELANWAYSRGIHRAALLTASDPYGIGFRQVVGDAFRAAGGQITLDVVGQPGLNDYRAELKQLSDNQSKYDAIFASTSFTEGKLQFRQLTSLGGTRPWYVLYPTLSGFEALPEANGRFFGLETAYDQNAGASWTDRYHAAGGKPDTEFAGSLGYDSIEYAARAVAARTSTSVADTKQAFLTIAKSYTGPSGPLVLDSDFTRINQHFAKYELQGGKYVTLSS